MTQKALWLFRIGAPFRMGTNSVPEPGPGEVLVKLEASALNPFDVLVQESGFPMIEFPVILGQDAAGVVEKVGEGVTKLVEGDEILFQTGYGNDFGSFQEYCLAVVDIVTLIPPNISFEQAASISNGIIPFVVATYGQYPEGVGLTPPFDEDGLGRYADQAIVILGGSSSLGQYAIQLARLSGFSPIVTTASGRNKELLLSLGATHVLDRHLSPEALKKQVRQLVRAPLEYIFDAISIEETQQVGYDLLAPCGTLAVVLEPSVGGDDRSGKRVFSVMGTFHLEENRALGVAFSVALTDWLAKGKIKPNPVEVLPGGLNGIVGGLRRLASGRVSGTKLVVRPPETR